MVAFRPLRRRRTIEDTPGMEPFPVERPLAAKVRLGGSAVRPGSTVESAAFPRLVQVATGRDHLCLNGIIRLTGNLAEIGRLPAPDQGLQLGLGPGAEHFHLEVPAAGRASTMVGRGTRSDRAGVFLRLDHRQAPGREGKVQGHLLLARDDPESVTSKAPGLPLPSGPRGHRTGVAQGGTSGRSRGNSSLEVSAPDVESRVHHQIAAGGVELPERDLGGMPQEPGGLVVQRHRTLLQRPDPKRDGELLALRAEALAGRK